MRRTCHSLPIHWRTPRSSKPECDHRFATLTVPRQVALRSCHRPDSNNQTLADEVLAAGEVSGDRCWQRHCGSVRRADQEAMATYATPVVAAPAPLPPACLKEFVGEVPWVHLDIAGTAYARSDQTYVAP